VLGPSSFEKIFDTLHMWILASLHRQSLTANKNLAARFWWLVLWLQYDFRTLLCGPLTIFANL
jgi:hypothetical protein